MIKPIHKCSEENIITVISEAENQTEPNESCPESLREAIGSYYYHLPENVKISIGILSQLLFSEDDELNRLAYDILASSEKATRQILENLEFTQEKKDALTQEACMAGLLLANECALDFTLTNKN